VAVSADGNPFWGALDPYWGGATAVAEAMRNVAAVGAVPQCLTDCLNFGNPEDPAVFHQFREAVRGLGDAARRLGLKGEPGAPVPFVSGNVSLYNESARGQAIPPSPIVACFGTIDDYSRAVAQTVRGPASRLVLVGHRRRELGGSVYYQVRGLTGGLPPTVDFDHERGAIYGTIDAIDRGLVSAAHDISEGGLVTAIFEMLAGSAFGVQIDLPAHPFGLKPDEALFSESGGFVLEVAEEHLEAVDAIFGRYEVKPLTVGSLLDDRVFRIDVEGERVADLEMSDMEHRWRSTVPELLA